MLSVNNSAITGNILEIQSTPPIRGIEDVVKCAVGLDQILVLSNSAIQLYMDTFVTDQ